MTVADPSTIDAESAEDRANRSMLAVGRKTDPPGKLSAEDAERLREAVPSDPVRLPKNHIACAACGQAADYPRTRAALIKVPRFATKTNDKVGAHLGYTLLSRCPACTDRRHLALCIAAAHPAAGAQLGGVVVDAIDHALVALEVLGKPLPSPEITDAELGSLIRTLSTAGRAATWESIASERSGQCARRPFGHVRQDTRTLLLRGWMDFYAERLKARRPPVAVPPPPARGSGEIKINDGCVMCGIDHVDVPALRVHRSGGPAAAAVDVWTSLEATALTSLGGPTSVERVSGSVCPACTEALGSAGAVGMSAMEISLARRLESLGDEGTARVVRAGEFRLVGWAALVAEARQQGRPDPAPNTRPWSHVRLPADLGDDSLMEA